MFSIALIISIFIGVALAILVHNNPRLANVWFNVLNVVETIPELALFIFLLPILGLGERPTIAACIAYSILPIMRNAYTGLAYVSSEYVEIATAMGLTKNEILLKIRFPMALPLISGGVRVAVVYIMGIVTLGGLIAAGGLGVPLQAGIYRYDIPAIIIAALWVGTLGVFFDFIAWIIENRLARRYNPW
ncbi:MAG: glycine betaine transporter membrane protein [Candidatus Methanofastidiosum methylothiophilum]|uniref:Glycine betaine transporter membrane protein n=1 Tax=Candidatus Methanofastidiosum methylothiophilum TaxID=1705564 RepID=A0A150IKX6_9EURY|nr:MAG: glycine betaine transporter membrane protein [Candidatus Methanofastidiosum methylthiophilus]KYC47942.1 MAG: glycine betaine transporter membrane protein [Candidatus Methanofastidiosum methylthiophilus]KYC50560.1 MAG: glycine betaine transporter membrane protein [Candidatus Methanofastidiosum methylthiophilus]